MLCIHLVIYNSPSQDLLSPPLRNVNSAEIRRGSQSSNSDSSYYPAPNPAALYGPQPISPQPSLPTTNSTISLDNPIFQSPYSNKHFKVAKGVMPHPHSGSVPLINMYNAGSVHGNSIGQGLDRPHSYNVNISTPLAQNPPNQVMSLDQGYKQNMLNHNSFFNDHKQISNQDGSSDLQYAGTAYQQALKKRKMHSKSL